MCKHSETQLILDGNMEWCTLCGAYRAMRRLDVGLSAPAECWKIPLKESKRMRPSEPSSISSSAAFETEMRGLLDKYRYEWSISYAEVVGVLHHTIYMVNCEWKEMEEIEDMEGS